MNSEHEQIPPHDLRQDPNQDGLDAAGVEPFEDADLLDDRALEPDDLDEPEAPELNESEAAAIIRQLQEEKAALHDQMLRAQAEFINSRRMQEQRAQDAQKFATEKLVMDLLPALDNFDRALRHIDSGATIEQAREGIAAVQRQILTALERQRVSRVASVGEHFNPEWHEAIAIAESPEAEDGVILEELEAGYKMADRVIRPARVRVARRS
ncbi:MAG: nucleotide exchange factor GrpE [Fimbriimonadaceae bacterium]|nr:nucleotide exchange factor GrpE [Fimbriimonadaceae bacterium]